MIFISHGNGISYDSQLYHLQTIQLNNNYKTIFGIGNLQPHYGMNSSWHSFLGLINYNYKNVNLIYLANISLFALFINELFSKNFDINKKLSNAFLALSILYIFSYSYFHPNGNGTILNNLGSPEADTVSMVFFILALYLFLLNIESKTINHFYLFSLSIFLIITIKISYIGIFLFFIYIIYNKNKNYYFNKINFFILISTLLWFVKSIFLTGCLIFPIKQSCIKTSWSMNFDSVESHSKIIQSFARDTPLRAKFTDFDFTLNSYQWVIPWFKEYFLNTEFLYISFLIIIINIIILLVIFFFKNYNNNINIENTYFFVIVILFLNLIIWMRAPEIRFGYGSIISLVSLLSAMILIKFKLKMINKFFYYIVILLSFVPITLKNKDNFYTFKDYSFVRNFVTSDFKMIYKTNNYKVYQPNSSFCNNFDGFCTYQGYKVSIDNMNDYLFIKEINSIVNEEPKK
ncbi:hypothetical protein N8Z35_04800 [Pelagibacteraceae bacterium]|nr:hypothetical protein [Pelagibacteraceae bacterium]